MEPPPVLSVEDLAVSLPVPGGAARIVRGVSFRVPEGGFHALVGESGCGKSLAAAALTRLPPAAGRGVEIGGRAVFRGLDLLSLPPRRLRRARGRGGVAYVFQDPMSALDPVLSVGTQLREAVPPGTSRAVRERSVRERLAEVGLPDAGRLLRAYPCELSGGMAQRVCLAMALAQEPTLVVADEPTTALDVLAQRAVLGLLRSAASARGAAVLLITHNLALVARHASTVSVLYAGQVVEDGPVGEVLSAPEHPYTRALLAAVPRLEGTAVGDLATIPGRVPPPREWDSMPCAFAPRCPAASPECFRSAPPLRPRRGAGCVRCRA